MEKKQLTIIDPKEFGLEEKKGTEIAKAFEVKLLEFDGFKQVYESIITKELTPELCKEARELRLKLVKIRTGIADVHKVEKAFYFAASKYIDTLRNKLTLPVEQIEEKLADIEKHFERIESERKESLKLERIKAFDPYGTDVSFMPLGEMNEEQFQGQLNIVKIAFEAEKEKARLAEIERIEAEEKAEAERLERERLESERLKAQRLENIRLKEEAEFAAKELEIERKRQAEIQAKKDAEAKAEQNRLSKIAADEKAKADKLAKKIAEAKAIEKAEFEAEEKRKRDLANAGDKAKFKDFYDTFKIIKFPELQNKDISDLINAKLVEVCKFMKEQANKLV